MDAFQTKINVQQLTELYIKVVLPAIKILILSKCKCQNRSFILTLPTGELIFLNSNRFFKIVHKNSLK